MGRRKKYEKVRELIIETAERLFGQYGYEKTTLDDITQALSIGKATLYNEFASKEEILLATFIHFLATIHQQMQDIARHEEQPVVERIRHLLLTHILLFYDHTTRFFHAADILVLATEKIRGNPELKHCLEQELQLLSDLLEKAAGRQEIPPQTDYPLSALVIRKALKAFYPPFIFYSSRQEIEKEAGLLIDILLNGLQLRR